jgi:hypothetical protein
MIIIGAGGGFAYVVYTILARSYFWEIWLPPVAIILVVTGLFAFVKIFNVPFSRFILLFIEYNVLPRKRKWLKSSAEIFISSATAQKSTVVQKKVEKKGKETAATIDKLEDLSHMLDTYGEKIETLNKK